MIRSLSEQTSPPLWSVMIPTRNPSEDQLAEAVGSVLSGLGCGGQVQLEIVDDASDGFEPARFVAERRLNGVGSYRHPKRLGMVGNWNACIRRAHGCFVHLLHQDDFVLAGFYAAMRRGLESVCGEQAGAAFCASSFLEADGRIVNRSAITRRQAGVLADWREHVFAKLQIQTPAIVVRREVYERLGGFDEDFVYASDWDMWKRIAVHYPLWYEPRALACYRRHGDSQTARLRRSGATIVDISRSIARSRSLLPGEIGARLEVRARRGYALFAVEEAFALMRSTGGLRAWLGNLRAAFANLREGRRLGSNADFAFALANVSRRAIVYVCRRYCLRATPRSD